MEVSKRSVNRGYHVYKVGLDDLPCGVVPEKEYLGDRKDRPGALHDEA